MVKAAYDLFSSRGYLGTRIADVAAVAGVAVPTVYYTFGTKAALLGEALGAAIIGFDLWREPPAEPIEIAEILPWHDWWSDFLSAPSSREGLRIVVKNGTGILQRVAPLVPALVGSVGDPEAARAVELSEQRRIESYREMITVIATRPGGLRAGLTRPAATDIMASLFSAEVYQAFADRGWSHRRCRTFFDQLLAAQLLA